MVTTADNIPSATKFPIPSTSLPSVVSYGSGADDIPDIYQTNSASLQFTLAICPYTQEQYLLFRNVGQVPPSLNGLEFTAASLPWYDDGTATLDYIIDHINTQIIGTKEWKDQEFRLDIKPTASAAVMVDQIIGNAPISIPRSYVCTIQFLYAGTYSVPDLKAYIIRIVDVVDKAITAALTDNFIQGNKRVGGYNKVWRLVYDYRPGHTNFTGIPTVNYQGVKFTSADIPSLIRAEGPPFRSDYLQMVCSEYYVTNTTLPTISVANPRFSYILSALLGMQPRLLSEFNTATEGYQDVVTDVTRTGPSMYKRFDRIYRAYHKLLSNPTQYITIQCDQVVDSEAQGQMLPILYQKPVDEQFNGRFDTTGETGVRLRGRTDILTFRVILSDNRPIAPSTSVQQLRISILLD